MGGTRYIVAGRFIDGSGGSGAEVRRNVLLAVRDGIITSLSSASEHPRPEGAVIDDLSHCTILPALVDCSVSLARSPAVEPEGRISADQTGLAQQHILLERHIRDCHAHGVLGVIAGEDINALPIAYQPGRGEGGLVEIRIPARLSLNKQGEDAALPVGGDFLKLGYSADIEEGASPEPRFDQARLCRLLRHRGDRKTVVVANGRQRVAEALAAGCGAIEQGYASGEENLREMAKRDVLWIPSLLRAKNGLDGAGSGGDICCRFSQRYVAPGKPAPEAAAFWQKMLAEQLSQLRLARKLGVKTALGTGAGSIGILHGESMVEEMKLFIKAGYSLAETIYCASEAGAGFFGLEKLGALAVGRPATFLVTRGTVQQLPRKLSYLEGIYVDGLPSRAYRKV